jgi:hypothetical protein
MARDAEAGVIAAVRHFDAGLPGSLDEVGARGDFDFMAVYGQFRHR